MTFVNVTGRDACMRAKSCGLFETSCFCLKSILACVCVVVSTVPSNERIKRLKLSRGVDLNYFSNIGHFEPDVNLRKS